MSIPSAAETVLMNEPLQSTVLYLSIYQPDTLFSCQVTGSYDAATRAITYYGASGDYTDITEFDFLIAKVGTTAGGDEKGHTYVRNATSTQLQFARSDHINWANGDYVTVIDFIEVTPLFPRIIQDPADELNVIFYKFYDVAYTNQNGAGMGSFVSMGCDYAGFLDPASGLCNVFYTASGTANTLSKGISYSWEFEGAQTTGSIAHTPGDIVYDTPGHYKTVLEVTVTGSAVVDRGTRYVSIYNRPGYGNNLPIINFGLTEISGNRESGGWRVGFKVDQTVAKPSIVDGALVVIFADERFGSTVQNIGGNALGRKSIKFVGYIENGSIQTNYQDNDVTFTALSPTGVMQLAECYGISLASKASPTTWYEMLNMTIQRAAYHYLRWHSTVLKRHDFEFVGVDRDLQYFENDRESLYASMQTLLHRRMATLVSDSQGKLWAEQEPFARGTPETVYETSLAMTKNHWLDTPNIDEIQISTTAWIEMGGIFYAPATDTFSAHLASAPGVAPKYRGKVERTQGLALGGQAELNTLVGNKLAWDNSRYPSSDYKLRHPFPNLDIAPQEYITVTMAASDNPRNLAWTNKQFLIRSISKVFNPVGKSFIPTINLHEVVTGFDGVTITIPDTPPVDNEGGGGGSFDIPPLEIPPIPVSSSLIRVFHNGSLVGIVGNLNFVDDSCLGTI